MVVDLPLVIGIIGMILILVAFFQVQSHAWSQDGLAYDVVNFAGSVLLVIYGITGGAWPFVILNGVWALYSLKDIILDLTPKYATKRPKRR